MKPKRRNHHAGRDYTAKNKHHLTPRSRGGDNSEENLFLLRLDRHFYWHKLFGNKTLEEVIGLLQRVHRAKGRCPYAKARKSAQCRLLGAGSCQQVNHYTGNGGRPLGVYGSDKSGRGKKFLGRRRP